MEYVEERYWKEICNCTIKRRPFIAPRDIHKYMYMPTGLSWHACSCACPQKYSSSGSQLNSKAWFCLKRRRLLGPFSTLSTVLFFSPHPPLCFLFALRCYKWQTRLTLRQRPHHSKASWKWSKPRSSREPTFEAENPNWFSLEREGHGGHTNVMSPERCRKLA